MLAIDRHTLLRFCCSAAVAAAVLVTLGPVDLRAETAATEAFQVRINEKEMRLATDDAAWIEHLTKDLGWQRMVSRNMPFVELLNDLESSAPIVELRMTIGDTMYHFSDDFLGAFALVGTTTPDVEIESSVEDDGSTLVVEILNGGLQPGDLVRFKIDIDPNDPTGGLADYADYREVMLGATTSGGDNSAVQVAFEIDPDDPTWTDWVTFGDATASGQQSYNYTSYSNCCCCCGNNQPLDDPYEVTGKIEPVPEPGSIVLCLIGLLGGAAMWRRRSQSAR